MKASESLIILYEVILELKGQAHAKEFISTAVYNIVSDILDEGIPLSPEEIDRRLEIEATDFKSMLDQHKKKSIA